MIRAAAKNHTRVSVVVEATDYETVIAAFRSGDPSFELRQKLAAKAFAHTAGYDTMIAGYLGEHAGTAEKFPERLLLSLSRKSRLRYGENPHQQAASYLTPGPAGPSVIRSRQLQGKELSFNNLVDADTALGCALAFAATACVIVKHANPCGVALAPTAGAAYAKAYAADPTSAFGGVIAFNTELDESTATAILRQQFVEVVIAPSVTEGAMSRFGDKPDVRVLACGASNGAQAGVAVSTLTGGLLLQDTDAGDPDVPLKIVTQTPPTDEQARDLRFAWQVVRFVKSNAIVFAGGNQTLGVGAGQMSRIMSTRIAAMQAAEFGFSLDAAVMASDAFFPFRDNVDLAAGHGIRAIVQPGGSRKDNEVIAAADEHGIAMAFTGVRHFRH
jgi:phosphoribosylaminoimidazolecarboxamide formyltransferase/IMP cyclohydrolase